MACSDLQGIKDQVAREFECNHNWRTRRKAVAGGREWFVRQCIICGFREPTRLALVALTDEEIEEAEPVAEHWHDELVATRQRRFWQLYAPIAEQARAERRQAWWTAYDAYLRSPEWRARRASILARDPVCCVCDSRPSSQVHHLTYARVKDELPEDLMGICTPCHEKIHEGARRRNNA